MSEKVKFKVGDLVYCPCISSQIMTIKELPGYIVLTDITKSRDKNDYGFVEGAVWQKVISLKDGICIQEHLQAVCHATQNNYELLSKLYPNATFEPPPKRKEPKDIIEDMLNDGYHGVLCQIAMVDEDDDSIVRCYRYDYALEVLDDKIIFSHHTMYNDQLKFVSPFYQKSGMEIVDFINGKIVLQNGKVVLENENGK